MPPPSTNDRCTQSSSLEREDAPLDDAQNDDLSETKDDDNMGEDRDQAPASSEPIRRSSTASGISFDESLHRTKCNSWSKERKVLALFGCLSSILVCIIRLKIDPGYRTYTIHSIIVFFDMILIHLFTATRWLVSQVPDLSTVPCSSIRNPFLNLR